MKAKKGKELVLELMDDLLGDSSKKDEASADKKKKPAATKTAPVDPTKSHLDLGTKSDNTEPVAAATNSKIRALGNPYTKRSSSGAATNVMNRGEASLAQSENLRIAQQKIIDLETEMERLRGENEALGAAGETLRRRSDELLAQAEAFEKKYTDSKDTYDSEKEILLQSLSDKDREVHDLQSSIEELETRLSSNIKKIRVRERELENRLELVKLESSALARNKDEIILDLKRQIDQLSYETDNYRLKSQELNKKMDSKQEVLRRTVKALRIALALLEGADTVDSIKKKAE